MGKHVHKVGDIKIGGIGRYRIEEGTIWVSVQIGEDDFYHGEMPLADAKFAIRALAETIGEAKPLEKGIFDNITNRLRFAMDAEAKAIAKELSPMVQAELAKQIEGLELPNVSLEGMTGIGDDARESGEN